MSERKFYAAIYSIKDCTIDTKGVHYSAPPLAIIEVTDGWDAVPTYAKEHGIDLATIQVHLLMDLPSTNAGQPPV